MRLNLTPDHTEIRAILRAQVSGPYRFVHDALKPYVRIEPESPQAQVTLHASAKLRLIGQATARTLTGPTDFVILFDVGGIRLAEVSPPDPRVLSSMPPRAIHLGRPMVQEMPEGGDVPTPRPKPSRPRVTPMVVAPEPEIQAPVIPIHLRELCTREDLHPELGDYVVVPPCEAAAYEPRPPWVIATDSVDTRHIVKPRLGEDRCLT